MMYNLSFIAESDFEKIVLETIDVYNRTLSNINLEQFNSNIIDPIKFLFDKEICHNNYETVINFEIARQKDKTHSNAIGYFHQNMFKYIQCCEVPEHGWDIIVNKSKYKICVEMKNKHNTMNSSSAQRTYIKMLDHILNNKRDYCYLVEVISTRSQNVEWQSSVDGRRIQNKRLRKVSIDQFYKEVTGVDYAFYQLCMQLPVTIKKLITNNNSIYIQNNNLLNEIKKIHPNYLYAFYLMAFKSYEGFDKIK